jgi:uncharacterized membrane protein YqjE
MALEQRERIIERGNGRTPAVMPTREPSIGELFGQLSSDASRLIQSEVALAKAELRETTSMLVKDAAKVGVAAALGLLGALAATAFLIIGLGDLLDNYWASALLVTIVYLAVAGFLAKSAMNEIKSRGVKPEETLATLREDASWAKREAQSLKRDLTSPKSH